MTERSIEDKVSSAEVYMGDTYKYTVHEWMYNYVYYMYVMYVCVQLLLDFLTSLNLSSTSCFRRFTCFVSLSIVFSAFLHRSNEAMYLHVQKHHINNN